MEKCENILKTLDEAIARKDSDLDFYRKQYHKATDEVANLTKKVKELEEELDFYKPNNCKGEQVK